MRHIFKHRFWRWLGLAGALLTTGASSPPTLTIAADLWCPINCAEDAAQPGIGIELAKEIFEPLGYRIHYTVMPWTRALAEVRSGMIDAAIGAKKKEAPDLLFPKTELTQFTDDFYALEQKHFRYQNLESLRSLRMGITADYGYVPKLTAFIYSQRKTPGAVQIVGGDDALQQNIQKLLADRIDIVVESEPIMDYQLKQMGLKDKVVRIGGLEKEDIYLAFSPGTAASARRVQQFDEGMARLKRSGRLAEIYGMYGLTP